MLQICKWAFVCTPTLLLGANWLDNCMASNSLSRVVVLFKCSGCLINVGTFFALACFLRSDMLAYVVQLSFSGARF